MGGINLINEKLKDKLTILLYHGVTESVSSGIENKQKKHINVDEFRMQMEYINKYCNPISIDKWLDIRKKQSKLPNYAVIVSFDDGFENNYNVAYPILKDLRIPAVLYISSGIVSTSYMFWVDVIEDCLNYCELENFDLSLDRLTKFFIKTNEEKFKTLIHIKKWCKKAKNSEVVRLLKDLQEVTKVKPSCSHALNYSKIKWSQLIEMSNDQLITIGAHGYHHKILSKLNNEDLQNEIFSSLHTLESKLNKKINHFSYPEGQKDHYNEKIINLLKKSGIICSPTAISGFNDPYEDPFHLKRIMVGFEKTKFPFYKCN